MRPPAWTLRLAAAAWLLATPALAFAKTGFPNQPIRIVVPYAAGGSADFLARLIASELQKTLGESVLVENRPGASGNNGTVAVAKSSPDGYTLLLNTSSFIVNPSLYKPVPFDPIRDFEPIADVASATTAFAANKNAGINTIADVVAQAKADPQKLNYGTGGRGSMPHLATELLKLRAHINITHVPFAGGGPAMLAALAGTTQLTVGALANMHGQLAAGELKGLAIAAPARWFDLPEIPTMIECGFPDFVMETTHIVVAPAHTPSAVVELLGKKIVAALHRPEIADKIRNAGYSVIAGGPAQLKARIAREVPFYKKLVNDAGLNSQ